MAIKTIRAGASVTSSPGSNRSVYLGSNLLQAAVYAIQDEYRD